MAGEKIQMVPTSVTDMAKAKELYAEKLGWSVINDQGAGDRHWVTLELPGGGTTLTLSTMAGNLKPGSMTLWISSPNVEALHGELKAKGVNVGEVKDDLYGKGSGVKWFSVEDPDGNQLTMVQS